MFNARVIQVIDTDLERRGKGVKDDPIRRIRQFYTLEGELLMEHDPINRITDVMQSCVGCTRQDKKEDSKCDRCARNWSDQYEDK